MGSAGNSLIKGISPKEVSDKLESFYAYEELTAQFAKAAINPGGAGRDFPEAAPHGEN